MTFLPVVPIGGLGGLAFLTRTREAQQSTFVRQPQIARDIERFEARVASFKTPADLVADRSALTVALGAFGLDDDINNRYFIEKILSSNSRDPASLASRFSDKRYVAFARAFGFGDLGGPRTADPGFTDRIVERFTDRQFERAVGESDPDLRLAIGFQREMSEIASRPRLGNDAKWFTALATPPVRTVLQTALGLPSSFAAIDLDQQLADIKSRARVTFGTDDFSDLAEQELADDIVRKFLVRAQIQESLGAASAPGSIALLLLQTGSPQTGLFG